MVGPLNSECSKSVMILWSCICEQKTINSLSISSNLCCHSSPRTVPNPLMLCGLFIISIPSNWLNSFFIWLIKRLKEKSRECHNHKPQPIPWHQGKRRTEIDAWKIDKHRPALCSPSKFITMLNRTEKIVRTKSKAWMDELGFYVPSTVFQSFRDDGRVNMKGSVQWSAV